MEGTYVQRVNSGDPRELNLNIIINLIKPIRILSTDGAQGADRKGGEGER